MSVQDLIAESQRREAYRQGVIDGSVIALLGPAATGDDYRVYGQRMHLTVEWPDGPPPPSLLAAMLERAQLRQREHDAPVSFAGLQ